MRAAALFLIVACGGGDSTIENPTTPVVAERPVEHSVPEDEVPPPAITPPPPTVTPEPKEPAAPEEQAPLPAPKEPGALVVRSGDSLSKILARAGIGATAGRAIVKALETKMDPTTIRVGQKYAVELAGDGSLAKFSFRLSATQSIVVEPKGDSYVAREATLKTTVREETIVATVQSSLWAALTSKGHNPAVVDVIVNTFAYDIDFFTATHKGDTVRLIVERHEADGEFVHYGRVLAATYKGKAADSTVLWWRKGDRYVDGQGRGVVRTLLKTPLKYARVSSGFNRARMHPVLHKVKSHRGVDYAAPEGTPVWAAAGGTIAFRGPKGGAGNLVVLAHSGGLKTQYMHLSRFRKGQKVGQKVAAKTVIGYVGKTGLATGAHLHFGVLKNGKYVDPQKIESARGPGVPKSQRSAFNKQKDRLLARLAKL